MLFGFCIGVIYLALTICCPKVMLRLAFIGAFLTLLAAGIILLVTGAQLFSLNIWNILLAVALIILALMFLSFMICYGKEIKLA